MELILNRLLEEPVLLFIAVLLVILLAVTIVKKLLKLFFILLLIALLGFAYLHFTGKDPQKEMKKLYEKGKEKVVEINKVTGD